VTQRPRLTRGRFLGALLAAALVPAAGALRPWRVLVAREPRAVAARLAHVLRDHAAARAIGAEYVSTRPREASAAALVAAVAAGVAGGRRTLETVSDGELRALLEQRTSGDFAEGRTVTLRGWILSETEARLCALASLLGSRERA
jgi:nitroreductase